MDNNNHHLHDIKASWQKQAWVFVTLDGARKGLIAPAHLTSTSGACRILFKEQFDQLLNDYDTYGPHKGSFIPRVESTHGGGFSVHWDQLHTLTHNIQNSTPSEHDMCETPPSTAVATPSVTDQAVPFLAAAASQSTTSGPSKTKAQDSKSILENKASSNSTKSPITPEEPILSPTLTFAEAAERAKAELGRRKKLRIRDEIGEFGDLLVPAHMANLDSFMSQLEEQLNRLLSAAKLRRQEQLHAGDSVSEGDEDNICSAIRDAKFSHKNVQDLRHDISVAKFGGLTGLMLSNAVHFFVSAVRDYEKVV